MAEVAKGKEGLSQLAIHGNYRAATAQDMVKVYSANLSHREIFVLTFAQNAFQENKSAESIEDAASVFSVGQPPGKTPLGTEFQGLKPADWAMAILKEGHIGCLKKGYGAPYGRLFRKSL